MKNQNKKSNIAIDTTGSQIIMVFIIAILVIVAIIFATKSQDLLKWIQGLLR